MNKIKLFALHFNECDPVKCTSLKLKKFGLVTISNIVINKMKNSILLDPFAERILSEKDIKLVIKYGITVIDCSWKNILNITTLKFKNKRKLSPLIATNPVNYGKWEKLSSVEALAAALYIIGFKLFAKLLLSKFSWGTEFLKLNFEGLTKN